MLMLLMQATGGTLGWTVAACVVSLVTLALWLPFAFSSDLREELKHNDCEASPPTKLCTGWRGVWMSSGLFVAISAVIVLACCCCSCCVYGTTFATAYDAPPVAVDGIYQCMS